MNVKNAAARVEVKTVVAGEDKIQNEMIVVIMISIVIMINVIVTVHMIIHNRAADPDMIQEMIVGSYKKQSCNEVTLSRARLHAWRPMVPLSPSRRKRQTNIPEKL